MARAAFLLVLLLAQAAPTSAPIVLGDAARRLTAEDLTAIGTASADMGTAPWLIAADDGWINSTARGTNSVAAYLPAQTTTADLRRGTGTVVTKSTSPQFGWTMQSTFNWAQVKIADRELNDLKSDRDVNRPFVVIGRYRDNEVLGIVRFVRSSPAVPQPEIVPGGRVPGDWPIMTVSRGMDTFKVLLRAEKREALVVEVKSENNVWSVVSASMVSID